MKVIMQENKGLMKEFFIAQLQRNSNLQIEISPVGKSRWHDEVNMSLTFMKEIVMTDSFKHFVLRPEEENDFSIIEIIEEHYSLISGIDFEGA